MVWAVLGRCGGTQMQGWRRQGWRRRGRWTHTRRAVRRNPSLNLSLNLSLNPSQTGDESTTRR